MARYAKIIVALLCLVCVLALCVAPYVDIPVTVLKSLQNAILLMVLLGTASLLLADILQTHLVLFRHIARTSHNGLVRPLRSPIEASCVQQC